MQAPSGPHSDASSQVRGVQYPAGSGGSEITSKPWAAPAGSQAQTAHGALLGAGAGDNAAAALGLGGTYELRSQDGSVFVTDGGHHIVDASFGRIPDPVALANALSAIPGVVEHGLFIGIASRVIVGREGGITELDPKRTQ